MPLRDALRPPARSDKLLSEKMLILWILWLRLRTHICRVSAWWMVMSSDVTGSVTLSCHSAASSSCNVSSLSSYCLVPRWSLHDSQGWPCLCWFGTLVLLKHVITYQVGWWGLTCVRPEVQWLILHFMITNDRGKHAECSSEVYLDLLVQLQVN